MYSNRPDYIRLVPVSILLLLRLPNSGIWCDSVHLTYNPSVGVSDEIEIVRLHLFDGALSKS